MGRKQGIPTATVAALISLSQAGCQTEEPKAYGPLLEGRPADFGTANQPRLEFRAIGDARVWQDEPDTVFPTPGYVGISASIEGQEGNQHVVPHEQRTYLKFLRTSEIGEFQLFSNVAADEATGATLELYLTSGTCRSSFNNKDCGIPIEIGVYAVLEPFEEETLTWGTQPRELSGKIGSVILKEDYFDLRGEDRSEGPRKYKVELPGFPQVLQQNAGAVYGLMLAPTSTGVSSVTIYSILSLIDQSSRDALSERIAKNQADVTLGTTEEGFPAKLTIETTRWF